MLCDHKSCAAIDRGFYRVHYKIKDYCRFLWVVSILKWIMNRSSCLEVFCKKDVLRNFWKFTGKHLCQKACNLLKTRLWHKCFPVNFEKFLRTTFFLEHLWCLLQNEIRYNLSATCRFNKLRKTLLLEAKFDIDKSAGNFTKWRDSN